MNAAADFIIQACKGTVFVAHGTDIAAAMQLQDSPVHIRVLGKA